MTVIVCIDDCGGMMFNNRRQSRDRVLYEDIAKTARARGENLYFAEYSRSVLSGIGVPFNATDAFLDIGESGDILFCENRALRPYLGKIKTLIIYRWNREYPADLYFDLHPDEDGFKLISVEEFVGSSHKKIIKETYTK